MEREDPDRGDGLDAPVTPPTDGTAGEDRDEAGHRRDDDADERDRVAGRRDRAAGRRDLAAGQRDAVAGHRDEAADQRDQVGQRRDEVAGQRDRAADRRDVAADERDRAADRHARAGGRPGRSAYDRDRDLDPTSELERGASARRAAAADRRQAFEDRLAGASERTDAEHDRGTALVDRDSGATQRAEAEHDRSTANADRGSGASERNQAEHDRHTSSEDRGASARDREHASLDGLTGAYQRGPGTMELAREVARAQRTGEPLGVAFVDVDDLKAVNDGHGHAAGDRVLVRVTDALRARLRPYDLVVRYGGDEFVCALPGLDEASVTARLATVNTLLAGEPEGGSVTIGVAALRPEDSAADVVARADTALYRARQRRRAP